MRTGKKKTKSYDGMEVLPVDMLMLVFCWLPDKTLASLRCVSKRLLNLVNLYQVNHLKHKPVVLVVKGDYGHYTRGFSSNIFDVTLVDPNHVSNTTTALEEERHSVSFKDDGDTYTILYSSGLLVFFGLKYYIRVCDLGSRQIFTIHHRNLYFTIKRRLPNPNWVISNQGRHTSFGFLPTTGQHKIVDFFTVYPSDGNPNELDPIETSALVITLPSKFAPGLWKYKHVEKNCLAFPPHFKSSICVGGIIYWILWLEPHQLLIFDLETENFQRIKSPVHCDIEDDAILVDLVELQGVVCVAQWVLGRILDIWFLKKDFDNNSFNAVTWVKEYSIDYSVVQGYKLMIPCIFNNRQRRIIPCQVVANGKNKTILFNSTFDGSFFSYNLKEKTFKKLGKHENDPFQDEFIHYSSLSPVFSGLGMEENCWNILLEAY